MPLPHVLARPSDGVGCPARDTSPTRVLHSTESLAAGVGIALARLTRLQVEEGASCTVLATRRYDTPPDDELRTWFDPRVRLIIARETTSAITRTTWLARRMREILRAERFDVVHLHSSLAGAIGRIAAIGLMDRLSIFYSPHGFAFLRRDLSRAKRLAITAAEWLLARIGGVLILVSASEAAVARRCVSRRVEVIANGVDDACLDHVREPRVARAGLPTVVMVGRVAYQKAPWRFAAAARAFDGRAQFRWIGYGQPEDVDRWLGDAPVEVTGRLSREETFAAVAEGDVVFFPTLWEGMPISLIEAQAIGLPAVASDVVGNRDVVEPGLTGMLCRSEKDMMEALERLIADEALRTRLGRGAIAATRARFSGETAGRESLAVYRRQHARNERPRERGRMIAALR